MTDFPCPVTRDGEPQITTAMQIAAVLQLSS
jgi:hypothetical protein